MNKSYLLVRLQMKLETTEDFVNGIRFLPATPPIILDTSQTKILGIVRHKYRLVGLWLNTWLAGESLSPELKNIRDSDGECFEETSRLFKAYFDLAVGIHLHSHNPEITKYKSPYLLWFRAVETQAQLEFLELIQPRWKLGKRQLRNMLRKTLTALRKHQYDPGVIPNLDEHPFTLLAWSAQDIASKDKKFHKKFFLPFLSAFKNYLDDMDNNQKLQIPYLKPNGDIFWTGQHRTLKKGL